MNASQPLEVQAGALLLAHSMTLCATESCTGGLLLSHLTDVSGSSAYVLGGVVAYSNAVKHALLGVQEQTLNAYGAVSEQTAGEMASGARRLFGADVALSITGIAGPGGGTPEKPVGLTYIGLATAEKLVVQRYLWTGERAANKAASVQAALRLLLDTLQST